jgi:hypothetical protein
MKVTKMKDKTKSGEPVYNWYRLDKNISWFNVRMFVRGFVYGIVTLRIFMKSDRYLLSRGSFWLVPRWEMK